MNKAAYVLGLGLLSLGMATAQTSATEGVDGGGPIHFGYSILEPNPQGSYVRSRGDTVSFRLFYVDTDCSDYAYYLFARSDSLIVCRTSARSGDCDPEAQSLYGVEGVAANVPSGRYQFILQSTWGSTAETLFRDIVDVN